MSDATLILAPDADRKAKLEVAWTIDVTDATCWRMPVLLRISCDDVGREVYLSRDEARIIRDFLSSILQSPDLREC